MNFIKFSFIIFLILMNVVSIVYADNKLESWKQKELNENFMRNLTKHKCMEKTIASIKNSCDSDDCLKTLAGINGDCITWASGNIEEFCFNYDREYISKYCATNELNARQCIILHIGKPIICK